MLAIEACANKVAVAKAIVLFIANQAIPKEVCKTAEGVALGWSDTQHHFRSLLSFFETVLVPQCVSQGHKVCHRNAEAKT